MKKFLLVSKDHFTVVILKDLRFHFVEVLNKNSFCVDGEKYRAGMKRGFICVFVGKTAEFKNNIVKIE